MTDAPPLVELIDVSIHRQREQLLAKVSLHVACGHVHVIVGPNGAGKTTLLSAVLGLTTFDGRIIAHWRRDGRIGFVPQSFTVDPSLPVTVEDFLALTRQARPVCFGVGAPTRRRIAALLEDSGLGGLGQRPLSVLSGGELRRVLLAHALDPLPELLILDEPGAGLDESSAGRLEDRLRTLKARGVTVLMVSHDLDQVRRVADRVTVLDRAVVTEGPPGETLALDRVAALLPSARARSLSRRSEPRRSEQ
jgi:zinc transport system ATP-binding protein